MLEGTRVVPRGDGCLAEEHEDVLTRQQLSNAPVAAHPTIFFFLCFPVASSAVPPSANRPIPRTTFVCVCHSSHAKAAVDVYTQALGMCPDHDDGLVARGAAFATTGRLRQAVQDLSHALSVNPHNDNASRYLKETRRCGLCDAWEFRPRFYKSTCAIVHVGCV